MTSFEKVPGKRADNLNASENKEGIDNLLVQEQMVCRKEIWSAHFTIWAAAFGLISDGCKFLYTNLIHINVYPGL